MILLLVSLVASLHRVAVCEQLHTMVFPKQISSTALSDTNRVSICDGISEYMAVGTTLNFNGFRENDEDRNRYLYLFFDEPNLMMFEDSPTSESDVAKAGTVFRDNTWSVKSQPINTGTRNRVRFELPDDVPDDWSLTFPDPNNPQDTSATLVDCFVMVHQLKVKDRDLSRSLARFFSQQPSALPLKWNVMENTADLGTGWTQVEQPTWTLRDTAVLNPTVPDTILYATHAFQARKSCSQVSFEFVGRGMIRIFFNGKLLVCGEVCENFSTSSSGKAIQSVYDDIIELPNQWMNTESSQILAVQYHSPNKDDPSSPLHVQLLIDNSLCSTAVPLPKEALKSVETEQWLHLPVKFSTVEQQMRTCVLGQTPPCYRNVIVAVDHSIIANRTVYENAFSASNWSNVTLKDVPFKGDTVYLARKQLSMLRAPDCPGFTVTAHFTGIGAVAVDDQFLFCGQQGNGFQCQNNVPSKVESLPQTQQDFQQYVALSANWKQPLAIATLFSQNAQVLMTFANASTALQCSGTCTDNVRNGLETGIDCGGHCSPCAFTTAPPTTTRVAVATTGAGGGVSVTAPVASSTVVDTVLISNTVLITDASGSVVGSSVGSQTATVVRTKQPSDVADTTSGEPNSELVVQSPETDASDQLILILAVALGAAVFCCILIAVVAFVAHKKKSSNDNTTNNIEMNEKDTSSETEFVSARNDPVYARPNVPQNYSSTGLYHTQELPLSSSSSHYEQMEMTKPQGSDASSQDYGQLTLT